MSNQAGTPAPAEIDGRIYLALQIRPAGLLGRVLANGKRIDARKETQGWRRDKKLKLILKENADWADLSLEWREDPGWSLEPDARPRLRSKQAGKQARNRRAR